ncbi:MAG: alpha/beta hydrolase [Campylobacterota bacterium]|nr:alpha/beta hydrolase [Campylobacterota bacterium]
MYYKDIGECDSEVILFLHGLGVNSESWSSQIEFFKKDYRIIVPDLRGHGETPLGDADYSFEACADDLASLLKKLEIKKVHICGFSMGGMIASEFVVKYPNLVSSICIVNSLPSFKLNSLKLKLAYQFRRFIIRFLPVSIIIYFMGLVLFPNHKELRERLKLIKASVNKKGYIVCLDAMHGWDIEAEFIKTNIDTLFVGSEFDYEIFDAKKEVTKKMKNAKYIEIKSAHHFVIWEDAEVFNNVYGEFVDSI